LKIPVGLTPLTLPGVEGQKTKKGKQILTPFTEISVWDDDPSWALSGVEGKNAEEKG
jgi:hypothetical protein